MKFAVDKKIRFGYFSAFSLLAVSYLLLFSTTGDMLKRTSDINGRKEIISQEELVLSCLKDKQGIYRGYLLTGKNNGTFAIAQTRLKTDSALKHLSGLLRKDTSESTALANVEKVIQQHESVIDSGFALFNADQYIGDTLKQISLQEDQLMQNIKAQILAMQQTQHNLNDKSIGKVHIVDVLKIINFISLVIATIIAIYSLFTYTRENKARRKSDEQSTLYRQQLETRVTELDKANHQLAELKMIEKFAASGRMARTIAHEVRNPLTNISLANDQLQDAVEPNEENAMLLGMIKRNGERINHLIGDLLNATKFVELNRSSVSINELMDEVVLMAQDRIDLKKVSIQKNYAAQICNVNIDAVKIKVAVLNILINAVEAVEAGSGVIRLTTTEENKLCKITITDNGPGITEENASKIFEPFFTSKDKGNGLGLTNAQNIIFNHEGTISVDSKKGEGSKFHICLNMA